MKRDLSRMLIMFVCFMVLLACVPLGAISAETGLLPEGSKDYKDIAGHWAEKSINLLISKGYVKGIEVDGRLEAQPNKTVTRAEFVTLLSRCRQFDLVQDKVKQFSDVKDNDWFRKDLDRLSGNSIVNGLADGSFGPGRPITRAEIAALICRAYGWETSENIGLIGTVSKFSDVSPTAWYYQTVMIDRLKKAINGNPDGTFAPARNATRAEAMTILANLIGDEGPAGPGPGQSPSPAPGVQPTPTPSPTPFPGVQPTPSPTHVYNPHGVIAYDIKAGLGEMVYFQIYSFGMKDLGQFKIRVNYDPAFAKAVNVVKGTVKSGGYIDVAADVDLSTADKGYITVSSRDNTTAASDSGTIFTVVFELQPNVAGGTDVTLTGGASDKPEIYDSEGKAIEPLSVKNGSIKLKE